MNKKSILVIFILVGMISCNSNDNNFNDDIYNLTHNLSGVYIEYEPVIERTQLNFINQNTLVRKEMDSSVEDEFTYRINGNIIEIKANWDSTIPVSKLEFSIIDSTAFTIENLYPSVNFNKTYMVFRKMNN